MVHTRNASKYSVQPDGSGKGRGKTRARSGKSSSRKKHLEDSRAAPHSQSSVPTTININSEPELIQGNVLRAEPFPSGSYRVISVPVEKLIQISQGRGVGNMPKLLEGGYELLLTHQELSGSGEDQRTLRIMAFIVLQRKCQKDTELAEKPKSFIHRPEERVVNDPSFGETRPSGIKQLQKYSRTSEE
ncbi:hypothetical protein O181_004288 [Austropuccinia psidii MF-1]|uniref:Uncharacterized protein n=1 Tax=Austropuccinia psidii MF-1 TaxID=1389203 RepID=A0A9Q3GEE0_9BASI|nr:hypothetical protein [Austropuccinia psidii MF-1]